MATSLAKQLQKLKVQQKDEIVLPQKSRISFIFDIKQAANIDDQSLYFLYFNALNSIQKTNSNLYQQLLPYSQSILHESSLNFYRGTQTTEQLKTIDDNLSQILKILSPYYISEIETHKIVEYLIRIYEINSYQKYDLIYGFLPFYETVWFMKISQIVNFKEDKWLEWLHEFSFKGEQISKQVLIRAMERNQATLFDQYARWLFSFESNEFQEQNQVNIHHQFLGFILSNILQSMLHSNKNTGTIEYQQTLYTLLPHISKCMNQNSSIELIQTGFMAIGYLGCGQGQQSRLSPEYAKAFLKQIIITLKSTSDNIVQQNEIMKQTGLKVLTGLLEFQKGLVIEPKDLKTLFQINKFGKLLNNFSQNYDITKLLYVFCETIRNSKDNQLFEIFVKIVQNSNIQINIKTFYLILTNQLYSLTDLNDSKQILSADFAIGLQIINFLKSQNQTYFDKVILHVLKQNFNIPEFKEKLSMIVNQNSKNEDGNILKESPFIKPFSLLSALCSQRRQVQINALQSLKEEEIISNEFVSKQELSLVLVHLSQIISEFITDQEMMIRIIAALKILTQMSSQIEFDSDFIFQKIEYTIHAKGLQEMVQDDGLNQKIDDSLLELALHFQPQSQNNQKLQAYLAFFFDKNLKLNENSMDIAQFLYQYRKQKQSKVSFILQNQNTAFQFVYDILSSQQLQPQLFTEQKNKNEIRSYFRLEQIDYILSVLANQQLDENKQILLLKNVNRIFKIIQNTIYNNENCEIIFKILTTLIKDIPSKNESENIQQEVVRNFIIVTLTMKQQHPSNFNLLILHNMLFKNYFQSDSVLQIKFYIDIILDSQIPLKEVQQTQDLQMLLLIFSIQKVKNCIEKDFMIDWASFIVILLAIFEQSKQYKRNQLKLKQLAIQLAETALESDQSSLLEFKEIYDSLSIIKKQTQEKSKDKFTPVKPQIVQLFLQNLIENKSAIFSDGSHIQTILKNVYKAEKQQPNKTFFISLLRVLPKLPSVFAKQNLMKQMQINEKQSLVYMLALSDILKTEMDQFEKGSHLELYSIQSIGKFVLSQCKFIQGENDADQQEFVRVIVNSLVLNIMQFCCNNIDRNYVQDKTVIINLQSILIELADGIYNKEIINILKSDSQFKILKIHLQLDNSYKNREKKKNFDEKFINSTQSIFDGKQISILLNDQINEIRKNIVNKNYLQTLLEVVSSIEIRDSIDMIQSLLILLQKLIDNNEKHNFSLQISILCILIDETIAKNGTNLQMLRSQKVDEDLNQIVLKTIKNKFLPLLTTYMEGKGGIDQEDPFNKFMQIIGGEDNEQMNNDSLNDDSSFDQIIIQMQMVSDLNRVAATAEKQLHGVLKKAILSLKEISNFLLNIDSIFLDGEQRLFSQKEERIIRHLLRFYFGLVRQVLITIKQEDGDYDEALLCSQREILGQFIQTVQSLSFNKSENEKDKRKNIFSRQNTINQYSNYIIEITNECGIYYHGHLAFIFLYLFDKNQDDNETQKQNNFQEDLLLASFKQNCEENHLSLLSNLLSTLSQIQINLNIEDANEQSKYQLDDKLKIVKSTQPNNKWILTKSSAFWLCSQFPQFLDQKVLIQLKSKIIIQIDQWINSQAFKQKQNKVIKQITDIVQNQTIDSQQTSQWIKDEFLWLNLSLGVMKDEVNFILSKKSFKNNKKLVKINRLSIFIDKLLKSLNEMISLEIHSGMVLKIMRIQDKDCLSLKTNSIQILIDKTPNLYLDVSKQNQSYLNSIFSPLIQEACEFISDFKDKHVQINKDQDLRNYFVSLFALIQQTSNQYLPQNLKSEPLKLSLELFQENTFNNQKIHLTLFSQILLCQSHLFEVYYQQQSVLEFLPQYSTMLIQQVQKSQDYFNNDKFFSVSYTETVLKSVLSLISINYQYLGNTDKWEQLLKHLLIVNKRFSKEIEQILLTYVEKAPIALGQEQNLQVVFNSFSEILVQRGCKNDEELNDVSNIAIRFFRIVLFNVCKGLQKQALQENYMVICEFFKDAMDFTGLYYRKKNNIDIPQIDDIEKEIVHSFQQFVVRLNEEQMGQVVISLVKWSKKNEKQIIEKEKDVLKLGFNLHRQIIFNKIMSGTLETLGEYAVPYIQYQLQNIIDVVQILIEQIKNIDDSNKKRSKVLQQYPNILDSQSIDGQGHTFIKLLKQICINLTLNFQKDNNSFIQTDIFEKIGEPLVSEMISLSQMKKHYKPFINDILKPLIFEMIDRIDNTQLWIQLNNSILMKSRLNYKAVTRLASLEIVQYLFTKLGERYLIVLNDTLPFLSESLEDDDHDVEITAKEIIKKIETLTGESIQEFLK